MTSVHTQDMSADTVTSEDLLQAEGPNGQELMPGDISFGNFAPATGGLAIYARNDIDKQIGIAIDDSSQYYSLSYSPSNKSDDPDKFRQINVLLNDPSMKVWTRTGYYLAHMVQPGEIPPPPPPTQLAFELTSAAQSAIPYSGLQVDAEKDGDNYKVSVLPLGMEYRVTKTGNTMAEVTVMTVAFGVKGKVISHQVNEFTEKINEELTPMSFEIAPQPDPDDNDAAKAKARAKAKSNKPAAPAEPAHVRIVVRDAVSGHIGTCDIYADETGTPPPDTHSHRGYKSVQALPGHLQVPQ